MPVKRSPVFQAYRVLNWNLLRKILEEMPAEEELKDDNVEILSNPKMHIRPKMPVSSRGSAVRRQLIPEPFRTFC
jgi:hypothetical protein